MRALCLCFFIMAGFDVNVYAQVTKKNIEDNLSIEIKKDSIVQGHVSNLKSIRKRLDSLGAKHPSRKQFEERLRAEEELLRNRLDKLFNSTPMHPNESGGNTKTMLDSNQQNPPEFQRGEMGGNEKSIVNSEALQTKPESKKSVPEDKIIDSHTVLSGITNAETLNLIYGDLAYPWIETRGLDCVGYFNGSKTMWAVETMREEEKQSASSVIWMWEDNWRVKERELFSRSSKPIILFHPSPLFQKDGLWFAAYADPKNIDSEVVEIWAHRVSQPNKRPLQNHLLCKLRRDPRVELRNLSFDPSTSQIIIGLFGEVEFSELNTDLKLDLLPNRGAIIHLGRWTNSEGKEKQLPTDKFPQKHSNKTFLTPIAAEGRDEYPRSLQPFWRKQGPQPSESPSWWAKRGQKIIRHRYVQEKSEEENAQWLSLAISNLKPGDMLLIEPGVYCFKSRFDLKLIGTEISPIVVQGEGPGVVFKRRDNAENVVNIIDSIYSAIGCLEITGGSSGIKIQNASQFMIYNSTIHDIGNVGIAMNSRSTSSIYIIDNEIYGTNGNGEGIYAGSHDGTRKTNGSFFVGNYIHDLACGPDNQGDGIEIKDRSFNNVVKWNYISRSKYPGITVYTNGEDGNPINRIIENVVLDSLDSGIQATSDVLIQGNWVSGERIGIASKPFGKKRPSNIQITGNTVFSDTSSIKASEWNGSDIVIANNFLYSKTRNYFHSGFGKALFIDNQFASELPENNNLGTILSSSRNRLIPRHDIFGQSRCVPSSIGAVEYHTCSTHSNVLSKRSCNFATFDPSDGELCFYEAIESEPRFKTKLTLDEHRIMPCERPLLYIETLSSSQASEIIEIYRVRILDPVSGYLYSSTVEYPNAKDTTIMNISETTLTSITGIGSTANSNLIFVHPKGLYALPIQ